MEEVAGEVGASAVAGRAARGDSAGCAPSASTARQSDEPSPGKSAELQRPLSVYLHSEPLIFVAHFVVLKGDRVNR